MDKLIFDYNVNGVRKDVHLGDIISLITPRSDIVNLDLLTISNMLTIRAMDPYIITLFRDNKYTRELICEYLYKGGDINYYTLEPVITWFKYWMIEHL
jgi:hypothetical protein